jgi:DNA-directed RNA polymerase delta subunit
VKKTESPVFRQAEEEIIFTIDQNNGIIGEADVVSKLNLDGHPESNAIRFFAECSKRIIEVSEKDFIEKSWAVSLEAVKSAKNVIIAAEQFLSAKGEVMTDEEIFSGLVREFPDASKKQVLNFLAIASRVKKNKFGKWGMIGWSQINPKGTREKVYLVLKEYGKPLHFSAIAGLIDQYGLGKRTAHPQTVHNELIKDGRFVLIGRGTYALKEWGYFDGTVKDVLKSILEKSAKPLTRGEIMKEVMKMRKVKQATVAINLNDSKVFLKQEDLYSIKKIKN